MKSPFECPRYARECRALANGNSDDRRREVLRMADIWEGSRRQTAHRQPDETAPAPKGDGDRHIGFGVEPRKTWAQAFRARFDEVTREPLPDRFGDLLKKLEVVDSRR